MPADFNYFIPSSLLADLRRQWVEAVNRVKSSPNPTGATSKTSNPALPAPHYDYPYLYNIANRQAQQFYGVKEPTAYELRGGDGPLMQCRHCLQYAMGYCVKHGGQKPTYKYPLYLRLGDGRRFRLEFDCKHCQMNVYAE
jgi:putative protease